VQTFKAFTLADSQSKPRRWTVIASGLLCGVLAVVVLFTNPHAFFSPLAVVVVGAIGLAAVLLQLRLYGRKPDGSIHPPVWLNFLGIVLALAALFSDRLRVSSALTEALALGAVTSFGISGAMILHAVRKQRTAAK
jgi:drug/metabolite transporter (DMT)-like permease